MHRSRHGSTAIFHARHYRAAINTFRYTEHPLDALRRYITLRGDYPWQLTVRTPIGPVSLTIPHAWDALTLNEIFFRLDYRTRRSARVVVDIGSNVGLSAAWFLSRRPDAVVYCYEPLPRNTETLRRNLGQFPGRWHLETCAVAPTTGRAVFLADASGRLSGLAEYVQVVGNRTPMEVDCIAVTNVIGSVLALEGHIDLVKIDTEGSEEAIVTSIPDDQMRRIGEVIYEGRTGGLHRVSPGHVMPKTKLTGLVGVGNQRIEAAVGGPRRTARCRTGPRRRLAPAAHPDAVWLRAHTAPSLPRTYNR